MTPGLKGSIDQELRIFFKQNKRIISFSLIQSTKNIYTSIRHKGINENRYEKLKINISFKDFKTLKKERKKSLEQRYNISRKKIPIEIIFNNEVIKASARLKGGLSDHYGNNKQFSMRIKLKNGKSIDGMREFSLTQHFARQYPQNVIYSELLSEAGIDSPKFITYKIDLNGNDWGLMLAEEQYSDAYLELRKKKYSPILKFTNENNATAYRLLTTELKKVSSLEAAEFLSSKHGRIENSIYNEKDFDDFYFSNILSYLKDLKYDLVKGKISSSEMGDIFDMDKFSKIFILSLISGDYHGLGYRNIRFYVNPFSKKLEPIATDWGLLPRKLVNKTQLENELLQLIDCTKSCSRQDYPIYNLILKNNEFVEKFNFNLEVFKNIIENYKNRLEILCKYQIDSCDNSLNYQILNNNLEILAKKINFKEVLSKNYKISKKTSISKANVSESLKKNYLGLLKIVEPIYVRAFKDGNIKILNLTPYNVEIKKVNFVKKNCKKNCIEKYNREILQTADTKYILQSNDFEYLKYNLKKKLENYESIYFDLLIDSNENAAIKLKSANFKIEDLNSQILENLDNFKIYEKNLIIPAGVTHIKKPLVLTKNLNLKIQAGATIVFDKGAYIEITGGNIEAIGNKNQKIYFKSHDVNQNWNGILVKESKNMSIFNYVIFQNLDYFKTSQTHLTGSINFYKSNVSFNNTEFINSIAEDFLNIISSKFIIKNSKFLNSISDGLDSDFSNGIITNTKFIKISGDAADFSGSKVEVLNSQFDLVGDKSISAGEISNIKVTNSFFSNSKIAIASKDQSVVRANNNQFLNSTLFDLIAFNKKSFYEKGGEIYLNDQNYNKQLKIKSDVYSKIFINGSKIKNQKIDLKKIY
ncbi:hypothetical protein ABXT63_05680 [Candidatus Pelagibacter sp. Uisw_092]|uniref:hypothetical protein n=1 Tax=Candidatus Pelagibacter sp. Uisw_092 TaxID=3230979 RepID=UPI0039EC7995